ncbi:U2 snRNP-associated protein Sf3b14 [Schizosaccharomyces octosporus yFS286]|uniref:U2 snRNP-associated protein Sf3b14 n=1 Tax=Schizosaccharomyces octosporus (strain yFS286) TaxID=483514 RepID=S9RA53_SCHOY|nr:U2 snRNP-associated protein Sf3b14 [Schizosaccharomyces octosporus yFS286]EPX75005.1 U2 snRNP-associated protein Sf3b14 [Schizosaccharomyces octosporus yFS286]
MSHRTANTEVSSILFVKNLSFKITSEEMYDLFGRHGPIRQIRLGNTVETRGTAFVVYENVQDALRACNKLSGYNFMDRYLVVHYYNPEKAKTDGENVNARYTALEEVKKRYGIQ